jgi:RsiW-degrading membrane proteinase PrsW (M82 family)
MAALGAIPALAALAIVDRLDRKRPEPRALRYLVAAMGAVAVLPVFFAAMAWNLFAADTVPPTFTYNGALFHSYVLSAGTEELIKIAVVYWAVWRRPEFDKRMDSLVYAGRAGLGFALIENVVYMVNQTSVETAVWAAALRAVLAVPGHALWTSLIGYFAARRRFDHVGPGIVGGYALAVLLHGTYDYAVFAQTPLHLEGKDLLANLMIAVPPAIILGSLFAVHFIARRTARLDGADTSLIAGQRAP